MTVRILIILAVIGALALGVSEASHRLIQALAPLLAPLTGGG